MSEKEQLGTNEQYCSECSGVMNRKAVMCPHCHVPNKALEQDFEGSKSKIVAGILAILIGGLGIHKFYLGKIGLGILYVIFFWTGIPAIIGFIEGIIYLVSSDADFARKYDPAYRK